MALISEADATQLDIPHEPGSWIRVRPLTAGDMQRRNGQPDTVTVMEMLKGIIVAWSYEDPITEETFKRLDIVTTNWLAEKVAELNGIRLPDEKKG